VYICPQGHDEMPLALRDLSDMREKVLDYYRAHPEESLYPSDVADALSLDAWAVYELTNILVDEGVLK